MPRAAGWQGEISACSLFYYKATDVLLKICRDLNSQPERVWSVFMSEIVGGKEEGSVGGRLGKESCMNTHSIFVVLLQSPLPP